MEGTRRGDTSPGHGSVASSVPPPLGATPTHSGDSERSQCHLPALLALNEVLSPCWVARAASNSFPAGSRALLRIPTELSLMGFNFNLLLLENTDGDPPLSWPEHIQDNSVYRERCYLQAAKAAAEAPPPCSDTQLCPTALPGPPRATSGGRQDQGELKSGMSPWCSQASQIDLGNLLYDWVSAE